MPERSIDIDWLTPTPIPAPSAGQEYSLSTSDQGVHVNEGSYGERPVHPGRPTTIRSAATVSAEKPGSKVVLGPERPNRKPE